MLRRTCAGLGPRGRLGNAGSVLWLGIAGELWLCPGSVHWTISRRDLAPSPPPSSPEPCRDAHKHLQSRTRPDTNHDAGLNIPNAAVLPESVAGHLESSRSTPSTFFRTRQETGHIILVSFLAHVSPGLCPRCQSTHHAFAHKANKASWRSRAKHVLAHV